MSTSGDSTLSPVARDHEAPFQISTYETFGIGDLPISPYDKSPYADENFAFLDVGPNAIRFRLHRVLLTQSEVLNSKPYPQLWGEKTNDTIALPELDEATAHTLVHYLYTAGYQVLRSQESVMDRALMAYKLATSTYCAATRYKLQGLADLAKLKITSLDENLSIVEILSVARESAFPGLPEDEEWYPRYVEEAVKEAATKDAGLFTRASFADQIEGDRKFRQVVLNAMVNTFAKGPPVQHFEETDASRDEREADLTNATSEIIQEEGEEEKVSVGSEAVEADTIPPSEPIEALQSAVEDGPTFEAIEPVAETVLDEVVATPAQPEPATDELGYGKSKTYQKYGKPTGDAPAPEATNVQEARPTHAHARVDSVTDTIATEQAMESTKNTALPVPVMESMPPGDESAANGTPTVATTATTTTGKKKNKKNKKKNQVTAAAPATAVA
ncbi:hypothetical protein EJ04DRAFT_519613 [Polyplosphaeria fusca]|uniref:BTB domain-containing protein n=1 Tax=Polyplosphaeria fusca TaxID=682080 RepID=A0A9P4R7J6_9PLEO|nr:hypothetical protein EJ04DRAFT_519613 [Polyplosphaeria fusca]